MGSRILLADDSITIQKVVNLTFADEGIEVVAVSNGDLAERRLNEIKPDLVLADIFMPGKNGYELCEAIKQNPQFRNMPVVLLVGAFEPFDQAEARRVQADAHLTKPFESRTLVETVRRLIGASANTTPAPITADKPNAVRDAGPKPTPLFNPPAAKIDLSAMMVDDRVGPVASPIRSTGELASPSPDAATEVFDLGDMRGQSPEVVHTTQPSAGDRIEPIELASIGEFPLADEAPHFDMDIQETILDFDNSQPFASAAPMGTISGETEASALFEMDTSGMGEDTDWFSGDSLETKALEPPSTTEAWQASATISPLTPQAADVGARTKAAFAPSGGSGENAPATLLAVDEPLGDVLFGEAVSAGSMPSSNDALDIDLTGSAGSEAIASTQFDLVGTAEDPSPQVPVAAERNAAGHEAFGVDETIMLNDPLDIDPAGSPPDSPLAAGSAVDSLDWTSPQADVYSTAQLDSVVMPIDTAEYMTEHSANTDAQQPVDTAEPAFEIAATWPEEEARFSAIDIEAFPVEEPEAAPDQLVAAETGFSLLSVAVEQPAASDGVPARAAADAPSVAVPQAAELSSAAIDEIVRRVVAEMSSSVVREVAWEVVPDCVERVVDQLTRESLSRRL